jgi:uncharacterized membrane protein YagU involved in acid resistance
MNSADTIASNAFLAIFWGGLFCGMLDISQAFLAWGIQNGVKPTAILHSVASGLLGPKAFQGGAATAALGLGLHFVIAFGAATVYYVVSRWIPFMTVHAVISGLLYGEMVFWFMHLVVVPLSRAPQGKFSMATLITGPIGHMFLVGLPIALAVRRYSA